MEIERKFLISKENLPADLDAIHIINSNRAIYPLHR